MRIGLPSLLQPFAPSRDALFVWFSQHLTPDHLDALALSDMATENEAAQISRQLGEFLHRSKTPKQITDFIAFEELGLERWRNPKEGLYGSPFDCHLVHAFSCACLLLAAPEPGIQDHVLSENETLVELVRSVFYLGDTACVPAQGLLAWRLRDLAEGSIDAPFFGLALLLLALRTRAKGRSVEGRRVEELCHWIVGSVDAARRHPANVFPSDKPGWFFGLNVHDQRDDLWRRLVRKMMLKSSGLSPEASRKVRELGGRILEMHSTANRSESLSL